MIINVPMNANKKTFSTKKPVYLQLPFLGEERSKMITNRIKRAFERTFTTCQLNVRYVVSTPFSFKTKDCLKIDKAYGVIYKFTCDCGENYIGRTGQQLGCRMKQHCPAWCLTGNRKRPRSRQALSRGI